MAINRPGGNAGLITAILALAACYGPLALFIALALLGVMVPIDEGMWAITISVLFAASAVIVVVGFTVHKVPWPAILAVVGFAIVLWVMFSTYNALVELAAFILLFSGALWDRSLRRSRSVSD